MSAVTQLSEGLELMGRYRIDGLLGKGGMGYVYKATDTFEKTIVALKQTFYPEEERRHWFEHEAKTLQKLDHQSLPRVLNYFADDKGCFLVMQFIDGLSLGDVVFHTGPVYAAMLVPWIKKLLEVLGYLHRQSPPVLHKDIKPLNIKVQEGKRLFLLDFGLAKTDNKTLVPGLSLHYSSPEQERRLTTDARSDLYSVGATMYYLLTAVEPIDADERSAAVSDRKPDPLEPIETHKANVPRRVAEIVYKLLALQPEDRFSTADDVLEALNDAEVSPYEAGRHDAEKNFATGKLILKTDPTEQSGLISSYKKTLRDTYKISTVVVDAPPEYLDGYAEVFFREIEKQYGPDFVGQVQRRFRSHEQRRQIQLAGDEGRVWRFFRIQNRASKSVNFKVLADDDVWHETTMEPLRTCAFWRRIATPAIKFRPGSTGEETVSGVESMIVVEGEPALEEAALLNFFTENESGELVLYSEF